MPFATFESGADTTASSSIFRVLTAPINLEFAAGLLVAVHWLRQARPVAFTTPVHPLILATCLVGLALWGARALGFEQRSLGAVGLIVVLFAPAFLAGVYMRCPAGPLDSFGRLLGGASFSIYLFHRHFLSPILTVWSKLLPGTALIIAIVGSATLSIFGAILVHLFVERPLVQLVQTVLARSPRRAVRV